MDTIKDLLNDKEGEGSAFLIACITIFGVIAGVLLIILLLLILIFHVVGINPQLWKMWVGSLSTASLQGPIIYHPSMDAKLVKGWQLIRPVAFTTVVIIVLYLLAIWAKSGGRRLLRQVLQRTCMQQGGWQTWPWSKKAMIIAFATGTGLYFLWVWRNNPFALAAVGLMLLLIWGMIFVYHVVRGNRKE